MKLLSREQMYAADRSTINKEGIPSEALMERAATRLFEWMHLRLQGAPVKIHLFCGIGNNGGDGLALARQLHEHGYHIAVYVVNYSKTRADDFLLNLERLKARKTWPGFLGPGDTLPIIGSDDIVVDAIFGIGLDRPPAAWVKKLMCHLNASRAFVLSIDIPSGLFTERVPADKEAVVRANHVLSFQAPKLVFFLPDTGVFINQWETVDIGLDPDYLSEVRTTYTLIGKKDVLAMYRPRERFSHKGTYGHALIIGGSRGKIGAVHLASKGCLHSGSGLVTAYVPGCGSVPLQTGLPEVMVVTDEDEHLIGRIHVDLEVDVVAVGPGLGTAKASAGALGDFLKATETPLVVDADALNILAEHQGLLRYLPKNSVLTPHPKELERLIGRWDDDFQKLRMAHAFSEKYHCTLVLKGAYTMVLHQGKGYVNQTGNPGMATAGSGDVLTGMIAGLIAQGQPPLNAAIFGVYLHGRAGDLMVVHTGYQALTALGIIDGIGKAFLDLFEVPAAPTAAEAENRNETAE